MFTDRLYTGQRQIAALGIYHYNARFYSPQLGRFLSADSIITDLSNPQYLNRYSYVLNNPLRYIDLSGHDVGCPGLDLSQCYPSSTTSPETNDGGGESSDPEEELVDDEPGPYNGYYTPDILGQCDRPHCYDEREVEEPYSLLPDYVAIEAGVPSELWVFGLDFVLTFDKYGRIYFGSGPSGGTSPFGGLDVNVSVSGGYIQDNYDNNTTVDEVYSFISDWSGGGCVGAIVGYCRVNGDPYGAIFDNSSNWANQYGLFTPQIGGAYPYSRQIYPP